MEKIMDAILVISILALCLLLSTSIVSSEKEMQSPLDFSHAIVLQGEVNPNSLPIADQINEQSLTKQPTIQLIINSPGGDVAIGYALIQSMQIAKARGKKFVCVVPFLAASMAFHILGYCDVRFAMDKSLLLFHEMAMRGSERMTGRDLSAGEEQNEVLSEELDQHLIKVLGISPEAYKHYNQNQMLWTAAQLAKAAPHFRLILLQDAKFPEGFKPYTFQ